MAPVISVEGTLFTVVPKCNISAHTLDNVDTNCIPTADPSVSTPTSSSGLIAGVVSSTSVALLCVAALVMYCGYRKYTILK